MEAEDLQRDISEILQRTTRIETKIERMEALEIRISNVEAAMNQQKGKMGVYTALSGFIGAVLGALLSFLVGRFT